ncbi:hypothetical protein QWY75_12365 [Pontixanthobacter aestiaquae]|nr:hypothetical protein [Pontixanthobacter aestiaquae]MDN3646998.1 hypothetical protein [Pontixanthobacter aestiaquae]
MSNMYVVAGLRFHLSLYHEAGLRDVPDGNIHPVGPDGQLGA